MSGLLGNEGPGAMGKMMAWAHKKGVGKGEAPGFSNTVTKRPKKQSRKGRVKSSLYTEE